jgi:hypothetical protein
MENVLSDGLNHPGVIPAEPAKPPRAGTQERQAPVHAAPVSRVSGA